MVRAALKEPVKAKAKAREVIYFRQSLWKNGVPEKQGEALRLRLGCCCVWNEGMLEMPELHTRLTSVEHAPSSLSTVITDTTEGMAGKLS